MTSLLLQAIRVFRGLELADWKNAPQIAKIIYNKYSQNVSPYETQTENKEQGSSSCMQAVRCRMALVSQTIVVYLLEGDGLAARRMCKTDLRHAPCPHRARQRDPLRHQYPPSGYAPS